MLVDHDDSCSSSLMTVMSLRTIQHASCMSPLRVPVLCCLSHCLPLHLQSAIQVKLNTTWLKQAREGQVDAASASSAGCSTVSIALANGKNITTSLTVTSAPAAGSNTAGAASAAGSEAGNSDSTPQTWTGFVAGEHHDSLVSLAAAPSAGDSPSDAVWAGTIRSSEHGVHTLLADPSSPNTYIMLQLDESKIIGTMLSPPSELPEITASTSISMSEDINTGRRLLQQQPNAADLDPYGEQAGLLARTVPEGLIAGHS